MNIKIVDNTETFQGLKHTWDRLLSKSRNATVFNSWEWNYYWWKHYGERHQLRILIVTVDNQVVGIAPFYIRKSGSFGPFSASVLELLGSCEDTSPDYLDLLCIPEHEAEVSQILADYIQNTWREWDVLEWTEMPEDSLLFKRLARLNEANSQTKQGMRSRISQTELPSDWEEFLKSLNKKKRNKIRNRRRHMEADANGRFFVWNDGNTLDKALETLTALHHDRWAKRSRQCAFSTNTNISFHQDIMKAFHHRDWLRLYCIKADDNVISMDYCFRFKGRIMQYQRGFDSAYYDRSPGFVLLSYSIEEAIKEGDHLFDFLKGEYPHKKEFETHAINTYYLTVYRKSWNAQWYRTMKITRQNLLSRIKQTRLWTIIKKYRHQKLRLPRLLFNKCSKHQIGETGLKGNESG